MRENIEQRTSNAERRIEPALGVRSMFGVRCSLFDVPNFYLFP
jgi:hypothetical protein